MILAKKNGTNLSNYLILFQCVHDIYWNAAQYIIETKSLLVFVLIGSYNEK